MVALEKKFIVNYIDKASDRSAQDIVEASDAKEAEKKVRSRAYRILSVKEMASEEVYPNHKSSIDEQYNYVKDLIDKTRYTNNVDDAWKIIDFLHDSMLLDRLYKGEK